ncbi:hypothetical protein OB2597_04238 [Pseudooceanicola batsensis HTCC2597]|uniref:AB hydrolase-1 domain-containing protein n=1 Tax=Pseudooceanicola batsensis (strain ATCC BAA-863 / DSM 15984 / KCTC 12145 / HTCC2597) TaxID=252305 RepID=A3U2P4_PSEBH|nr:alpha/beta hydrolase [Pseudooceanicola batsensis]EAQ01618.1 hypothetical protein OB2597_04238 [Pseudooceanicola batsensis HTCC2597]
MIPGFDSGTAPVNGQRIAWSAGGDGAPVLLLHGFPQTRALWSRIGAALAREHRVVAADLRGYGESSKPDGVADYTFREMGNDMAALMTHLGHDRGGRTAHRMALDHGDRIATLQLLDIIPTHLLLTRLRRETALAYYHWFFLAQPEPMPERMIGADPDAFFDGCLMGWGAADAGDFDAGQLELYRTAWRDPDTIRGMCNDYRAGATLDVDLDAADLDRRILCPTHVLWGADGVMGRQYDVPATWADRCEGTPRATPIPGGHFFPDTAPDATADALQGFIADHAA